MDDVSNDLYTDCHTGTNRNQWLLGKQEISSNTNRVLRKVLCSNVKYMHIADNGNMQTHVLHVLGHLKLHAAPFLISLIETIRR